MCRSRPSSPVPRLAASSADRWVNDDREVGQFSAGNDKEQWTRLKLRLLDEVELEEDSLRFYFLGSRYRSRIEHHGAKMVPDLEGPLIL